MKLNPPAPTTDFRNRNNQIENKKTKYDPDHIEVEQAVNYFLQNGGKIDKIEEPQEETTQPDPRAVDEFLSDCGDVVPRNYPVDYYG